MIFKNDMLLYGWNPPGGIFGREFKLVADVPAAARPKKQQHCLRKRTRRMCVTEGTLHATATHSRSFWSPRYWLENLVFPWNKWQGDNSKDAVYHYQGISTVGREEKISARARTKERLARGLHAATKPQPFISRRLGSTSQLISLVCLQVHHLICQLLHHFSAPKERLTREGSAWSPCLSSEPEAMASATLLKSSFLNKKAEWGATRQVAAPRPVTVSMVVRASAYADELVQTAVWFLNTSSIFCTFFHGDDECWFYGY